MSIRRRTPLTARIGILAVGHATYWPQFDGLLDELTAKHERFITRVRALDVEVESFGMVDDAESAYATLKAIKTADLDLLLVHMVTYATSSTFGILLRELTAPIVLVALQPREALDYERGSTYMQLCNDDICSIPEFTGVALRMGRAIPPVIIGMEDSDPAANEELEEWCAVARVLHGLRRARLGHMGHVLEAMLDMHTDPTAVTATFGCHVVQCEPDEILRAYREAGDTAVQAKTEEIRAFFEFPNPKFDPITSKASDEDIQTAARAAVALDAFVQARRLDGLAYYYEAEEGSEMRTVVTNLIVGNSLLCAAGFPMCGEYDIKTCIAMLIMDRLAIGGSFAEFHPVDFARDSVLVGHDGPHHLNIADGKPVLRSLDRYHGKPGSGASVEFQIKEGPITMLSINATSEGRFKFIIAEGESLRWPIPPTGNTNTHGRFAPDVRTFLTRWVAEGPTHHFALGVGHRARAITRIADCLGIESVTVTPPSTVSHV